MLGRNSDKGIKIVFLLSNDKTIIDLYDICNE